MVKTSTSLHFCAKNDRDGWDIPLRDSRAKSGVGSEVATVATVATVANMTRWSLAGAPREGMISHSLRVGCPKASFIAGFLENVSHWTGGKEDEHTY